MSNYKTKKLTHVLLFFKLTHVFLASSCLLSPICHTESYIVEFLFLYKHKWSKIKPAFIRYSFAISSLIDKTNPSNCSICFWRHTYRLHQHMICLNTCYLFIRTKISRLDWEQIIIQTSLNRRYKCDIFT